MVPMFILSIVAVAIVIERAINLRRRKVIPRDFMEGLIVAFGPQGTNVQGAIAYCARRASPVAAVVRAGIVRLGNRLEVVEKAVEDAAAREVGRMRRGLEILAMIGTISPLLGLLGMIYGMINAFRTVAQVGMGRAEMLAIGIYEALVATAAGLTVAVPCLLAYYMLVSKVERLTEEIEQVGNEFLEQCYEEPVEGTEARISPASRKRTKARIEPNVNSGF
jgi:biopolymer transport protein ExbB